MILPFENIWLRIQRELKNGQVVQNWSMAKGFTGNTFEIVSVTDKAIICNPPKSTNLQVISKKEFEKVWEVWDKYLLGKIPRYSLRDMTRFSSYIISILHLMD